MNPEEKKDDNSKEFGKVIDALHSKQKLSSLRTYQGDMAEFIKSKDESVVSIVVKEKERQEKKEKEKIDNQKKDPILKSVSASVPSLGSQPSRVSSGSGFQMNLTMLLLSILLIGGGALAALYIFDFIKKEPQNQVVLKEDIIPYNSITTLTNITKANLEQELIKLSPSSGISLLKISDINGVPILKAKDFFNILNIPLPSALERTLKDDYVIGVNSQNKENYYFMIIKVNDFGQAFSAMLDWEGDMVKDLAFLNTSFVDTTQIATTTAPLKPEIFGWKDLIIKNKDTRGLVNEKGRSQIAYTFLDKNTILIIGNIANIGEIASIYASRSFTR